MVIGANQEELSGGLESGDAGDIAGFVGQVLGRADPLAYVVFRGQLPETARAVSLVIGPEGGIADDEIAVARERGATTVSLGARNLRSETAAIAAVTVIMDRFA